MPVVRAGASGSLSRCDSCYRTPRAAAMPLSSGRNAPKSGTNAEVCEVSAKLGHSNEYWCDLHPTWCSKISSNEFRDPFDTLPGTQNLNLPTSILWRMFARGPSGGVDPTAPTCAQKSKSANQDFEYQGGCQMGLWTHWNWFWSTTLSVNRTNLHFRDQIWH